MNNTQEMEATANVKIAQPANVSTLEAQQEIELFALIMQAMRDQLLSDDEMSEINTAFNNSCLKECTFEAIKTDAFKKHVTPHLYHTRITDIQLEILARIGRRLGVAFNCLYELTGEPRRRINIF